MKITERFLTVERIQRRIQRRILGAVLVPPVMGGSAAAADAGGRVDAGRIAIIGTSRGGFMALQVAAREPRIACAVAYAPVTELSALREFRGAESLPAVSAAALRKQAGRR